MTEKKGLNFLMKVEPLWVKGSDPIFDSSELNNFTKEERDLISFKLNPLTSSKVEEVREKNTTDNKELDTKQSAMHQILNKSVFNKKGHNADLMDYMIVDWKGILVDGKDLKCNKKNKLTLVDIYDALGSSIIKACSTIAIRHEELKGNSEKN